MSGQTAPDARRRIRVLVVDDSAVVRRILSDVISAEPDLEVAGTAPDPYVARDRILELQPDVVTLDIEMPRMDGLTFLGKLMHYRPVPVIVISSLGQRGSEAAIEALRKGAVDVLGKPNGPHSVGELRAQLPAKIRAAASVRPRPPAVAAAANPQVSHLHSEAAHAADGTVIAIGASAGGTEAISVVLEALPPGLPGIAITQHIPAGFSKAFAERLNRTCRMEVREARDGDALMPGLALVAPGDFHMLVRPAGAGYRIRLDSGPRVCYQRPAVDVMFHSLASAAGPRALGVILTGMGSDGAEGLLHMKRAGARTIAQDEATCLVYGMPREAVRAGAVDTILPLHAIPEAILHTLPRLAGSHAAP
jgi:two-component system, chemotaxis family, protein-glutamate methylesterase/glutaminase